MKMLIEQIALQLVFLMCACLPYSAMADVYIDLSQADEINISSYEQNSTSAIKIVEPIEQSEQTAVIKSVVLEFNNQSKIDNKQLPYHNEVLLAAMITALDPALIHAVIATESKHNARAKSHKGAVGLMQLMPATASRFHVKDRNDPKQNILAGSKYLRELLNLYQGDLKLTLAAYNAGPGAVQKYSNRIPPYKETMRYVPKVLKYYHKYS